MRVCVRAHTGREMSAHKKTWSAQQNFPSKKFLHIFYARHPMYRRVLVNVAQKKFYVHTDFRQLEGTLTKAVCQSVEIEFLLHDVANVSHLYHICCCDFWISVEK